MNSSELLNVACEALLVELAPQARAPISERFAQYAPVLLQRLNALYGARADFTDWTLQLMSTVGNLIAQRPPALLALDRERAARPGWFASQQMLGYSTYVDRFAGNLDGVCQRVDYLRELGVTYLHLLPFLKARDGDNDGGFAVADFEAIAPQFGTMDDLHRLTSTLRQNGISLCADLVLNHVADDHAWARAAAGGDVSFQDYFHVFADRRLPDLYSAHLREIFPQAAPGNFTWSASMQRWIWTTFYPYQWDLNYANPAVFASMAATMLRLANHGIEVFRLDSTAFLWKRLGTDCMNHPETHAILQALRALVDIAVPAVLLKAEAIVPTRELPAYFGGTDAVGRECHVAYHSSLMAACWAAIAEQSAVLPHAVATATPALPAHCSWLTYVRCHDDIGWQVLRPEVATSGTDGEARLLQVAKFFDGEKNDGFAAGASFQSDGAHRLHGTNGMASALAGFARASTNTERKLAEDRLLLLYGVALGFGGVPVIYMGDELALGNDDSVGARAASALDGRWMQRPMFDLALQAQRHDGNTATGRFFQRMRRLISVRQQVADLAADRSRTALRVSHPAVLVLARGTRYCLLFNFSAQSATVALSAYYPRATRWRDLISDANLAGTDISLAPWGMVWLAREEDR